MLPRLLQKSIFNSTVGSIINRFGLRPRRDVLLFERPTAEYVKVCESTAPKKIYDIGKRWTTLCFDNLLSPRTKILPAATLLRLAGRVWTNLGFMREFQAKKDGDRVSIKTEGEAVTRHIGENHFTPGAYAGMLAGLFDRDVRCAAVNQTKENCEYVFKLKNMPFDVSAKPKALYDQLNCLPKTRGFTMQDLVKDNVMALRKGVYFEGIATIPVENTVLHLFSNAGILANKIPSLAHLYFKRHDHNVLSSHRKLFLIKTYMETAGLGIMKIISRNKQSITVEIRNPPYGLQAEPDNWEFMLRILQGSLWLVNPRLELQKVRTDYKFLCAEYSAR